MEKSQYIKGTPRESIQIHMIAWRDLLPVLLFKSKSSYTEPAASTLAADDAVWTLAVADDEAKTLAIADDGRRWRSFPPKSDFWSSSEEKKGKDLNFYTDNIGKEMFQFLGQRIVSIQANFNEFSIITILFGFSALIFDFIYLLLSCKFSAKRIQTVGYSYLNSQLRIC